MLHVRTLYRCALALTLWACGKPEDAVQIDWPALNAQVGAVPRPWAHALRS